MKTEVLSDGIQVERESISEGMWGSKNNTGVSAMFKVEQWLKTKMIDNNSHDLRQKKGSIFGCFSWQFFEINSKIDDGLKHPLWANWVRHNNYR